MPFELQYTSAPHGLLPGQSGLSTVKMTKGLPLQLRESLESLSSYHGASIEHAGSKQFQCSSLLQFAAAGSRWYVLSRSAHAGLDYTRRQTFFVHHVAFSPEEIVGLDPLSLLNAAGFLQSRWDGRVEELAAPLRIAHQTQPSAQFNGPLTEQWKAFIVDEALAGKQIYLITPENSSLTLVESLLAAATQRERWDITFITRFQSLSPTVKCAVRCLAPGTPLPAKFDRSQAAVVDATQPLGPAPPGRSAISRQSAPEIKAMVPAVPVTSHPRTMRHQPSLATAEDRWQSEAADFVNPNRRSTPTESPAGYSFGQGIALGAITALVICMALAAIIILGQQSRIAERDQTISDKTAELQKSQTDFSSAQSQQKKAESDRDSIKNSTSQQIELLKENKKTQDETFDSLENKIKEHDATITGLNKQVSTLNEQINELNDKITASDEKNKTLTQQLKDEQAKQKNNQPDKNQPPTAADMPTPPAPVTQSLFPNAAEKTRSIPIQLGPGITINKLELTGLPPRLLSRPLINEKGLKCVLMSDPNDGVPAKTLGDACKFIFSTKDPSVTFEWTDEFGKLQKQQQTAIKAALEAAVLKVSCSGNQIQEIKLSGQK